MRAHKLQVTVLPDHDLAIRLPEDFPSGPAEVIVLAVTKPRAIVSQEDAELPVDPGDWPDGEG